MDHLCSSQTFPADWDYWEKKCKIDQTWMSQFCSQCQHPAKYVQYYTCQHYGEICQHYSKICAEHVFVSTWWNLCKIFICQHYGEVCLQNILALGTYIVQTFLGLYSIYPLPQEQCDKFTIYLKYIWRISLDVSFSDSSQTIYIYPFLKSIARWGGG